MGRFAEGLRPVAAGLVLAVLAACGGGGSGDSNDTAPGFLPTLSQDIVPDGARVDVANLDLFPVHSGDEWVYRASGGTTGDVTRAVISGPDASGRFVLSETVDGVAEPADYRVTPAGIEALDPVGAQGIWPGIHAALPSLIEYPTPLYRVGGERKAVRQGDVGADLDGDGLTDFFRVEISQVFQGFETRTVLGTDTELARFTNRFLFTVSASGGGGRYTVTAVEEAWFAPRIGLVRAERSASDSNGAFVIPAYTLELTRARIDGRDAGALGAVVVPLVHSAVVFDARRGVYYASVPGSSTPGNRIAVVDPENGDVSWSGPVGSQPGPMAIASDGASMYVGLAGSGEVVRLSLPGFNVLGRVRLPADNFYGQLYAADIAVSPTAPGVAAVSLARSGISPEHGGVVLLRDLVVQPLRTQDHTGSNRIGFGADGRWLYGYNTETSEFGLRRIEVLAEGLAEREVVEAGAGYSASFEVVDDRIIVGSSVFRADAGLARLGRLDPGGLCTKLPGANKIACLSTQDFEPKIQVADASSFETLVTLRFPTANPFAGRRVVAGPAGQLAISHEGELTLFTSPLLKP